MPVYAGVGGFPAFRPMKLPIGEGVYGSLISQELLLLVR